MQDALVAWNATQHTGGIWVAKGVYYPDEGTGLTNNDKTLSFKLKEGMTLYGGFAGTESAVAQRNPSVNVSILSGDIDKNDTNTDGDKIANSNYDIQGSNSAHVVYADGRTTAITSATRIDGFVITAGQSNDQAGAGMYCNGAGTGGNCSPSLNLVGFIGNVATYGGALYNNGESGSSSPTLSNVTFKGNRAAYYGGAMYNEGTWGSSIPTLTNVTFKGNSAGHYGGAMFNDGIAGKSSPSLINVTFEGNSATSNYGGAIYNAGYAGSGTPGSSTPTIKNSIFWGNSTTSASSSFEIYNHSASPSISYSLFKGALPAGSSDAGNNKINIAISPFVDAANGNLQLAACSPAIDAGDNRANNQSTDLAGNPRRVNDTGVTDVSGQTAPVIDLGAFEKQASSSSCVP
ncbi:MAG: choice-of-anchor Q domain-containing protein [Deinococcales bacterium]